MTKKIHYCWFGGNPLPELALKCIASWKKYCPDYEIVEWNESNFDVHGCDYIREAYEAKKWAFVSDYARFRILYEEGGLYFDTDVELIRPLDEIVAAGSFLGREEESVPSDAPGRGIGVNPGLGMGAEPGLAFYREQLDAYRTRHFTREDGSYNLKTVVDYTTEALQKHGLTNRNDVQTVAGITVYPKEYFCPMDYISGELHITDQTCSIHHYSASWHNEKEKRAFELQRKFSRHLPRRLSSILGTFFATVRYDGFFAALKWAFRRRK